MRYVSDTSLVCVGPTGTGVGHAIAVTVSSQVASFANAFYYDAATVDVFTPDFGPTTGGSAHTITGANFDIVARPADAEVGETAAVATYVSDTSINVVPAAGIGRNLTVVLTILGYTEPTANTFSYIAPRTLSLPDIVNAPPTSLAEGTVVTITGDNFGTEDTLTSRVRSGGTTCEASAWVSDTTVACHIPSGNGLPAFVVSVAEQFGSTLQDALTYDGPETSAVFTTNIPTQGAREFTVFGLSFMSRDSSPLGRLGRTTCESSSWTSDTAVSCVTPEGQGRTLSLSVSILAPQFSSLTEALSYDVATVTKTLKSNTAAVGGGVIEVYGLQFGVARDSTVAGRVGGIAAEASVWTSDTAVTLVAPTGELSVSRGAWAVVVTAALIAGTISEAVTYDDIRVSSVTFANAPPLRLWEIPSDTLQHMHVIAGANFAVLDSSPTARIVGTTCEATEWLSDTNVQCQAPAGGGILRAIAATIGPGLPQSVTEAITYDGPQPADSSATNGNPTASSVTATVSGSGLSSSDFTPALRLDPTAFSATEWVADTSVTGLLPPGFGAQIALILTAGHRIDVAGTLTGSFSFDAGVVIASEQRNLPKTGSVSVTVSGRTFGSFDFSMSVRIGGTATEASAWVSDTSVVARAPSGRLEDRLVAATVNRASGTVTGLLTYDASELTAIDVATTNGPASGSGNLTAITVYGSQLGLVDYSHVSRFGGTATQRSEWASDTSLSCGIAGGVPLYARLIAVTQTSVTYNNSVATATEVFTYDHLHIYDIYFGNTVRSGGLARHILGSNFAPMDTTVKGREGGTDCPRTDWVSDTSMACYTPSGTGTGLTVTATVAVFVSTITDAFSYDDMSITATTPSNARARGNVLISFIGANYGILDDTPKARLGGSGCESSQWVSDTNIYCMVPRGSSGRHTATLTIDPKKSTKINLFSYNRPALSALEKRNLPTRSSHTMTLTGHDFATLDNTAYARPGATAAEFSRWVSDSSVLGFGGRDGVCRGHPATVTVGLQLGTVTEVLTFDAPAIAVGAPRNMNPFGGLQMLLSGANYVPYDATARLRLGGTSAESSQWTSESSVSLKAPRGMFVDRHDHPRALPASA
jgi:hypothetical protein